MNNQHNKVASKVLNNNSINLFLIRIDLDKDHKVSLVDVANSLSKHFNRIEKVSHPNINVNVDTMEKTTVDYMDYVLKSDDGYQIKIATFDQAIIFEANKYIDYNSFKKYVDLIIDSVIKYDENSARRIGMRYINNFECREKKQINKIFKLSVSKRITESVEDGAISRIINLEEYNYDECKIRVQYGIPNRFFPARIINYDLLLDIDVYVEGSQSADTWNDTLSIFNHKAYDMFVYFMNNKHIEKMR